MLKYYFDRLALLLVNQNNILNNESKLGGAVLAFGGAILFSTKAVLVKVAYRYEIDTASLLMLRMLFALPLFLAIGIYYGQKHKSDVGILRARKWPLLIYGLMGYYIASFLDMEGLQYIDASLERIIIFIYPTIVVILSYLWLKERINISQTISIVVCYTGIIIAYRGNVQIGDPQQILTGSLYVLGSAFTYSVYLVGSQQMVAKVNSRLYNSVAMCIAATAIIIHNALTNGFNLFDFPTEIYWIALVISTLSTVIPSFMIVEGIRILGANSSSIIGTIGPISTIILASIFLGEQINSTQWIGTFIVIGGVLYLMMAKTKTKSVETTSVDIKKA